MQRLGDGAKAIALSSCLPDKMEKEAMRSQWRRSVPESARGKSHERIEPFVMLLVHFPGSL
jgi:hypothetical protein